MADRFDLDAIEADDALLDLLAAGGESARTAGEHDPAVQLLADLRLAVEVEDELPVETIDDPESFLARCAALNPITDPFARKVATRGLALGVAAVAALSVSGVAAAVTGDPLSPYEKVIEKMVDAVRPQTSFPKEELDGLPVVDRSKIVKVAKDFQDKTKAEHAAQSNGKDNNSLVDGDPNSRKIVEPPFVVPRPDKPMAIQLDRPVVETTTPEKTQDPGKPVDTTKPTTQKTETPTDTTGGKDTTDTPTTPPDTPTTPTPTGDPTEPGSTPTSTPTEPTTTTTPSTPANVDTGTGEPTTAPSNDSGSGETTAPGSDTSTTPGGDTGATDGTGTTGGTGGTDTSGSTTTPGSEVTQVPGDLADAVTDLLEQAISPILPTPTGAAVAVESAERFFGSTDTPARAEAGSTPVGPKPAPKATAKSTANSTAKHSSGKVSTGSVRKTYPTGKHSTGAYPEGKHAAIDRTHGSTDDVNLLKILGIVNTPTK